MRNYIIYIYIYFRRADLLFANSSRSVSVTDVKLGLITGRRMGSVIRGKMIRYGREEHRIDSHSYGNRRHVCRAFTDGECEILDTLLCVKKAVQWQEETLALSGMQRHLRGPLCTNKQQKLHVLWFAQAKLPVSLLWLHIHSRDGVICINCGQELYS